ncbi:MAG: hypothetical protein L0Y71_03815 [Gemmataceae bacterium]|nr:hypothetical protein [Gemmataceae bacterium]
MSTAQDIPEIAAALAAFIADGEPYTIRLDPPLDLRALAAELQLLPAMLDFGGCLGLKRNGEVASFTWNEPHSLRAEPDNRIRNIVYYQASLKYPGLAPLVPRRPADAVTCSWCGGSGRHLAIPAEFADRFVCCCGGLGWLHE